MSTLTISKTAGLERSYNINNTFNNLAINANRNAQPPIQSAGKCAHGVPGGACPICAGQSGGGGGSSTVEKKKQVGMSWNEAYYVWTSIKKSERLAAQDAKAAEASMVQNAILQKLENTRLFNFLTSMTANTVALTAKVQNAVAQFVGQLANTPAAKALNQVAALLAPSMAKLIGVSEKVAAVFGEKLKAFTETVMDNMNRILEKLMQTAVMTKLIAVFYEEKEYIEDLLHRKLEELKAKILKMTSMMKSFSDELAEEYHSRKHDTDHDNDLISDNFSGEHND